jgi:hypothetical protein
MLTIMMINVSNSGFDIKNPFQMNETGFNQPHILFQQLSRNFFYRFYLN